jgi:diguanylate cyclase (GGDEF)-like protein
LTAIGNRRCAEEVLNDFYARFGISGEQPPVILFDIDGFKAINDSFGHATGDDVLISITQAVLLLIGDAGHLFRWGGDEFLLIASAKSIVESETVARQVLSTVGRLTIKAEDGEIKPTISMGISTFASEDQSYLDAVARADRMMYQAKSGLGNSYELAL